MSKKYIYLIIILCLIAIAGVVAYTFATSNYLTVGSSHVKVPNGYAILKDSEHGGILVNGGSKITIYHTDNDTDKSIKEYTQRYKKNELSIKEENVGNAKVTKIILKDPKTNKTKITHFFFDKDNKPYHIFIRGKYNDDVVKSIINDL